jgi:hypothetical protein
MSSQTTMAPSGTDRYLLMPKSSMLAAMPANSLTVLPRLVNSRAIMT